MFTPATLSGEENSINYFEVKLADFRSCVRDLLHLTLLLEWNARNTAGDNQYSFAAKFATRGKAGLLNLRYSYLRVLCPLSFLLYEDLPVSKSINSVPAPYYFSAPGDL